jgi:tetratricopeptide (TPR) repeat protein
MRNVKVSWTVAVTITIAFALVGCGGPDNSKTSQKNPEALQPLPVQPLTPLKSKEIPAALSQAFAAFEQKKYDVALAGAERVLTSNTDGRGAAEAHYLRGRVYEERAIQASSAGNMPAARGALQAAREAYNAAMLVRPAPLVEGNIRAGIANVAYFQDDYATAIGEGQAAFAKLADPAVKAWVLYRVGLSQQRFGNFAEADRTFAAVQQQFPGSEPARRAAAHQGARAFQVQVGTFATPGNATGTLNTLRSMGVIGTIATDASGRNVVRVGPAPNYEQAKAIRARVATKYPDAVIVP